MRLPCVRFTVRRMMVAVAVLALGLFVVQEFWDGLPPRFVVRGIPERIARLRPGMSWDEAEEVLGVGQSWLWGGTSARPWICEGNGHYMHETYSVRSPRIVVRTARVAGGASAPVEFYESAAMIQLWFATDARNGLENWQRDKSTRLVRASFASDSTEFMEMPRSR